MLIFGAVICFVAAFVCGLHFETSVRVSKNGAWWYGVAFAMLTTIGGMMVDCHYVPDAMDVYRGKTELERTYNGRGECIDSVVVFKEAE